MTEPRARPGKKDADKPKRVRSGANINVYIDPDLGAAIDTYLESLDPQITKTALVESLFRGLLREKGLWPPKPKPKQ